MLTAEELAAIPLFSNVRPQPREVSGR